VSTAAYAGILLALLTTIAYNTGLVLEKSALGRMPTLEVRRLVPVVIGLLTSPAWLTGFGLMLFGLGCQTVVLTFAPVSIVQPVLSCGVALVLVLSRLVLRERLGGGEFWCVAVIAVSVVLLALSAAGTSTTAGHDASSTAMGAVIVPSLLLGLVIAASSLRSRGRKHRLPATGVCYGVGTGLLYGVASLAIKALSGILVREHTATSIGVAVLTSPYLYVLGGCSIVAMLLYQVALQSCRASILIPVSTVVSSVYFLVAGTWLFHEHLPASPVKLTLRLAGIAVTGLVLVLLSRQSTAPSRQGEGRRGPAGMPDRPAWPAVFPPARGALQPAAVPPVPHRGRHPD
jgi:drug/metabolite transporter (DMT)-like permease